MSFFRPELQEMVNQLKDWLFGIVWLTVRLSCRCAGYIYIYMVEM